MEYVSKEYSNAVLRMPKLPMMTLAEMKLAVCEKLPELIELHKEFCEGKYKYAVWKRNLQTPYGDNVGRDVHWPTEGLQVCHEAEKLLDDAQWDDYAAYITKYVHSIYDRRQSLHAPYEQRLEALCRVWFPERF